MEALLPALSPRHPDYRQPAPPIGWEHGCVALFGGCMQDAFLSPTNQATMRVLQRNGYQTHFPPTQTCCGTAQLHLGELDLAHELARRNIDAFPSDDYYATLAQFNPKHTELPLTAHILGVILWVY